MKMKFIFQLAFYPDLLNVIIDSSYSSFPLLFFPLYKIPLPLIV